MSGNLMVLLARLSLAAEAGDFDSFEAIVAEIEASAAGLEDPGAQVSREIRQEIGTLRRQVVQNPAFRAENARMVADLNAAEKSGDVARARALGEALHRRSQAIMTSLKPQVTEREPLPAAAQALFDAIEAGDVGRVRTCLAGLDINARHGSAGKTALIRALTVPERSLDMVAFLLETGADPNVGMPDGYTPLHALCSEAPGEETGARTTALARALVGAGADVEAAAPPYGWTPLQRAVLEGRAQDLAALLKVGADPNVVYGEASQPWFSPGRLPLEMAGHDTEKVRLLLEQGADPRRRDGHGETTISYFERLLAEHAIGGLMTTDLRSGLRASFDLVRTWPQPA